MLALSMKKSCPMDYRASKCASIGAISIDFYRCVPAAQTKTIAWPLLSALDVAQSQGFFSRRPNQNFQRLSNCFPCSRCFLVCVSHYQLSRLASLGSDRHFYQFFFKNKCKMSSIMHENGKNKQQAHTHKYVADKRY